MCHGGGIVENFCLYRAMDDRREWLEAAEKRYNVSVPDVWFAANIIHTGFIGGNLTARVSTG